MKAASWSLIPALLLALLGSSYSLPADKEKIEEGRYALLKKGGLVAGSEHSWTLWRLPDGRFELEDHFQVDKTARALFGSMLCPGMPTSPEFRKSLQKSIEPSDLSAIFDPDRQLLSLTVSGVKLDGDKGVGLKCKTSSTSIECTGTSDKAKLRVHELRGLFWWYGIPTLLRSWLASPQESSSANGPQKIAMLSFGVAPKLGDKVEIGMKFEPGAKISWGDKPALEPADLTISNLGPDTLVLGDRSFRAQKHRLEVKVAKGDPLSLTVWTDAKGVILAVEDANRPGDFIALVQYKNYSNPPPATSTPADKQALVTSLPTS
ncbi:MAG: hypothetical protein HY234_06530 [Acidobacteria bacterium]|nr:hypothetical protein [Acidobacteriota bacterium]